MTTPEPTPDRPFGWTDSVGSYWFIYDGPGEKPPEGTKVDPSTIQWPDGVPKPWEKPETGPDNPPAEK